MAEKLSNRGPKFRKPGTSPPGAGGFTRAPIEPTCKLNTVGRHEFRRLVAALTAKGTLGRADVGIISQAARLKAMIDVASEGDDTKTFTTLLSQYRGCLRELGLNLQCSRSVTRTVPGAGSAGYAHLLEPDYA